MYLVQRRRANLQPFGVWADALTIERYQPGPFEESWAVSQTVCVCGAVKCDLGTQSTHPCMCVLMAGVPTLVETGHHTHIYGHGQRVLGEGAVNGGLLG